MPLIPEKDEQHLEEFLWNSARNRILFSNNVVWNAQDDPIRLIGKYIGQHGLGDLYLEVSPNTSTWRQ